MTAVVSQTGLKHDALRASSLLMVDGLRPRQRATALGCSHPPASPSASPARRLSNARSWFPSQHPVRKVLHLVIEPALLFPCLPFYGSGTIIACPITCCPAVMCRRLRFDHYKVCCEAADPVGRSENSKIATHYPRPAMVWGRSACHASSNCSQIQIASESRVRRLNAARRSRSCVANPIFSVPLLILGSSGSWALGAVMATSSLVLAASRLLPGCAILERAHSRPVRLAGRGRTERSQPRFANGRKRVPAAE
jgi:hypothetical protein